MATGSRYFISPGLPPGSETEDALRVARLAADLARYASGQTPTDHELATAPLIEAWHPTTDTSAVRLVGLVEGHPVIRGPMATTSRIYAVDPRHRWIRTYSRLYRLGEPQAGLIIC